MHARALSALAQRIGLVMSLPLRRCSKLELACYVTSLICMVPGQQQSSTAVDLLPGHAMATRSRHQHSMRANAHNYNLARSFDSATRLRQRLFSSIIPTLCVTAVYVEATGRAATTGSVEHKERSNDRGANAVKRLVGRGCQRDFAGVTAE